MKILKTVFIKIRDFYEILVPSLAFAMMFFVFIWGIFTRYILKDSATWANEVQILGYIWTVMPAAVWARRRGDHVCFSLLYDSVDVRKQRIIRIIGNLFMLLTYAVLFWASCKYILNLRQKSMALEVSLKYLYLPFPIMIGAFWVYCLADLITDLSDIILEAQGKKEKLQAVKIDKAAEYLKASEAEFEEMFGKNNPDADKEGGNE